MTQNFDSQFGLVQNDNHSSSKETAVSLEIIALSERPAPAAAKPPVSHLKLVASKDTGKASKASAFPLKRVASSAILAPVYKSAPAKSSSFTAEVRRRSPDDFIMVARDPFHYLHCELPLKFEESGEDQKAPLSLICQFPTICDDALVDFIQGDEDLLGMALITFHMQILKNIFLFCVAQKAQNLIIKATEDQFKSLGIYQEFIKYVDKIPTKKGLAIEMMIPVHSNSLTTCDEFIDDMMAQFRKTLWQEQSDNAAIRDYLKANIRLSIVF